ncbi:flagellar basal body protein [Nesterenkonia pannonica]|uniref:flagellar basal body protein n=1 Tax=Nesterenkonia pannonica TaxID=1548602 RepID=UPI002164C517|nr:flagellar basal body protein [Nesterenkonia pannonica]
MSTFSGLSTAWSGLAAARRGLETANHNIANVGTEGYTRQRVETASVAAPATVGRLSLGSSSSGGVTVTDVARLNSLHLDARVRSTGAAAEQTSVSVDGLSRIESILREPGRAAFRSCSANSGSHGTTSLRRRVSSRPRLS